MPTEVKERLQKRVSAITGELEKCCSAVANGKPFHPFWSEAQKLLAKFLVELVIASVRK